MQPYIEFIFFIDGTSVKYALTKDNGRYEAEIEIKVSVIQQDTLLSSLHFILSSNSYQDSILDNKKSFYDIKNLPVLNGIYTVKYELSDLNNAGKPLTYSEKIEVFYPTNRISTSSIQLLAGVNKEEDRGMYRKYTLNMTPLLTDVDTTQKILPFFLEIYNSQAILGKDQPLLVRSYIESAEAFMSNTPAIIIENLYPTAPVLVHFQQMNIEDLPSGNYYLIIELRNPKDSTLLLTQKGFFQRNNSPRFSSEIQYDQVITANTFVDDMTDRRVLQDNVLSLYPIASRVEQGFIEQRLKNLSDDELKKYFFSFWFRRNPHNPEGEWLNYKKRVDYVQNQYGSKQVRGYRTDRGRIYLKYGPPSMIKDNSMDPQTKPYQIWQYTNIGSEVNVKFVFYSPAEVSNDYELLHSTKQGEAHNSMWQRILTQGMDPQESYDDKKAKEYWGGHIDDEWKYDF
jgi:GWxTD domain-containing protein